MVVTVNEVLKDWLDRDYDVREYDRVTKRFPVPDVRRAESPVDIGDLRVGDHVSYLGTFVKSVCRGKTRYSQPYMLLDLSDETGHLQGVIWGKDDGYINRVYEQIGKGKEAVVSGYIQEYPVDSGKLQMVINSINFSDIRVIVPDSHIEGTGDAVMQCILTLESLPAPFQDLALEGLEQHWDGILGSVDPESRRHKYYGGILTHLRLVLKILTYLYNKSPNPARSMLEIVHSAQPDLDKYATLAAGGEDALIRFPASIDYLYQIIVKTQEARKRPTDELSPWSCMVAAVFSEIGKLVEDKRLGSPTFGAQSLLDVADMVGLPYTFIAPIQDLIVTKPVVHRASELPRPADAWILHFAQYLADNIG